MDAIYIECVSCGQEFEFTIEEQRVYTQKQFDDPKRCPDCRRNKLRVKTCQTNNHSRRKAFDWSQAVN